MAGGPAARGFRTAKKEDVHMTRMDLASPTEGREEDAQQGKYLIFSMDDQLYGIEIRCITEIIGVPPIAEVPEMPEYIKGVTNLRGKIIPVMDARLRFHKPARAYDDRTCIIILNVGALSIGLIVDSVAEVQDIGAGEISPPPVLGGRERRLIGGVARVGGGVRLLLDCQRLLTGDEEERLGAIV